MDLTGLLRVNLEKPSVPGDARAVFFDAATVEAVTIRTVQLIAVDGGLLVTRRIEHVPEARLVQVTQPECDIALLDGAVGADPELLMTVTRDTHLRAFQQPVRDRSQSEQ